MTVQLDTAQLAEALYVAWRERMDFMQPLHNEVVAARNWRYGEKALRPAWRHLTAQQQDVWRAVAEAAGRAVADAMDVASA